MAKAKATPSKIAKKRSTKYSKLAAVCSKELAAKKKALVLAEKRLAKAQKTHSDLLGEVARLDMLERSLKAVNEGLEPPQNIKYVYTYPNWVWQPGYWQNSYPYNNGTITLGNVQGGFTSNLQTCGINSAPVITTTTGALPSTGVQTNCYNTSYTQPSSYCSTVGASSSLDGGVGTVLTSNSDGVNWSNPVEAVNAYTSFSVNNTADLTVDLSTGATEEGADDPLAEVKNEL